MENETTNLEMEEQTANQQGEDFLAGLGMPEEDPSVDQQEEKPEGKAEENPEGSSEEKPAADAETDPAKADSAETKEDGAESEDQHEEQPAPQTWDVNVLGEKRTVGVEDITPEVLQKGFDYDRIRKKYDEAKPVMEFFTEAAKNAG